MTRRFHVTFENGVLVPEEKMNFSERQKLTILVDEDFPDDPPPQGGVGLVDWQARHRLKIDPQMAHKIALSKAYEYYEEPEDE
jgi:hypothetical protein